MTDPADGPNTPRVMRTIWFALLLSLVFYGLIAYVMIGPGAEQSFDAAFADPIVLGLHAAGLAAFASAFLVSSRLLRGGSRPAAYPSPAAVLITPRMRLSLIVRWSMIESAAIFGLLTALLRNDVRLFIPLGALAFAGMLSSYPGDERLRAMSEVPG